MRQTGLESSEGTICGLKTKSQSGAWPSTHSFHHIVEYSMSGLGQLTLDSKSPHPLEELPGQGRQTAGIEPYGGEESTTERGSVCAGSQRMGRSLPRRGKLGSTLKVEAPPWWMVGLRLAEAAGSPGHACICIPLLPGWLRCCRRQAGKRGAGQGADWSEECTSAWEGWVTNQPCLPTTRAQWLEWRD